MPGVKAATEEMILVPVASDDESAGEVPPLGSRREAVASRGDRRAVDGEADPAEHVETLTAWIGEPMPSADSPQPEVCDCPSSIA